MEDTEKEYLPLSYILEFIKKKPDYRDVVIVEQMLSEYYFRQNRGDIAFQLLDEIRNHFMPADRLVNNKVSDEQIKEILQSMLDDGTIVMGVQFVAVYRILVDFCHFPVEKKSFCRRIEKMELVLDKKVLGRDSLYQSVQKGFKTISVFVNHFKKWETYTPQQNERISAFSRQKLVADRLLACLKERNLILLK